LRERVNAAMQVNSDDQEPTAQNTASL
jgi:hypothetical protein